MGYDRLYFLKKAYGIYPGVTEPRCAPVLAAHYRRRRDQRGALRAALDAAVGAAFLVWIPWRARRVQRKFGLDAAWRRRTVEICRTRFADPNDIALFRIDRAETLDGYIRRFEDAALNKRINPLGWGPDCALADKVRFYARCAEARLPHPPTVALAAGGELSLLEAPDGRELVAKPADGEGGDGVTMLGACADVAELEARLAGCRRSGAIIVQPRVHPDPSLADLTLSALPTVRIVTILDEAGRPEAVSATFRCASIADARVDNMKAGGLIAPVELETGRLGLACKGYGGGDYAVHPATGGPIEGRALPGWEPALHLARRAHAEAFGDYAMVGWDLALTAEGPVLIEGNGKPGVLMPQRAARRGLAQGRYGELLAHHLAMKR